MTRREKLHNIWKDFSRHGSVLRSTFFTISSLLLAMTLLFQMLLYGTSYAGLKASAKESSQSFLTLVTKLTEEKIISLCRSAEQLSWNETILNTALFPDPQNRPRNFQIVTELNDFISNTPYVEKVVLACRHDQSVYTSDGVFLPMEEYSSAEDIDAPAVTQVRYEESFISRNKEGGYCLHYRFIAGSYGYLSELLIYLDIDTLFEDICRANQLLAVYSNDGELIYSNMDTPPDTDSLSENELLEQSEHMTLVFCHRFTEQMLSLWEYLITNGAAAILMAVFAVVILISLVVAWHFYRPLQRTLQELPDDVASGGTDWDILNQSVLVLKRNMAQFNDITRIISPYVLKQLLCDMLDGAEMDNGSVQRTLSSIDGALPCDGTFLLLVATDRASGVLNQVTIERTIHHLQQLQVPNWQLYAFSYRYSVVTIAFLQEQRVPDEDEAQDMIHAVTVFTHTIADSTVLCSEPFYDLLEVRRVYVGLVTQSQTVSARESSREDIEKRICNNIGGLTELSEDAAMTAVSHLLTTIRQTELSSRDREACCQMLADSMHKLVKMYHGKLHAFVAEGTVSLSPSYFGQLEDYLHTAVCEVFTNLDDRQRRYVVAAQEYVTAHYMESDLSLDKVAADIGISASYLSRVFSESCGKRFTKYLSDLRIKRAKELLVDENKLIRDIAQEVGFLTVQNFMRVFKAKTGMTPGEYRSALLYRRSE